MNLGILSTFTQYFLIFTIAFCAIVGLTYLLRQNSRKKGDLSFSLLLFAFAFTLFNQLFILTNFYKENPKWLFLPIYFTLSFGPLLFFAIKLWLYSNYNFKKSDLKHAILPVFQFIYFIWLFFHSTEIKQSWDRNFYSPFYGAMEMCLYIGTFYAYLYSAYRYIRYKNVSLRHSKNDSAKRQVLVMKRLLQVLFILFWINSGYIVADFVVYEVLKYDLHSIKGFTRLGDISFGMIGLWIAWWGWRNLIGRKHFIHTK